MALRPLRDKVVVKPSEEEEKSAGGIFLPDTAKKKPQEGRVVAVGNGRLLEDGTVKPLILIKDWDFRWQHVYRFVTPLKLPQRTTLSMRYAYDNSSDNKRNPDQPPRRVRWGQRSSDEMGDLWIQVLTRDEADLAKLDSEFRGKVAAEDVFGYELEIERHPSDTGLRDSVAMLYLELGRPDDAARHFRASATVCTMVGNIASVATEFSSLTSSRERTAYGSSRSP